MHTRNLPPADLRLQRAAANQSQSRRTAVRRQAVPCLQQERQVLLPGNTSDVGDEQIAGLDADGAAIGFAAEAGVKAVGIDPSAPDPGVGDAPAVQMLLVYPRGTQHPMALTIEPAEIAPAGANRPINAIARGVLLIIGMGGRNHRNPQLSG